MLEVNSTSNKKKYPGLLITRSAIGKLELDLSRSKIGELPVPDHDQLQNLVEVLKDKQILTGSDPAPYSAGDLNSLMIINAAMKLVLAKTLKEIPDLQDQVIVDFLINEIGEYNFNEISKKIDQNFILEGLPGPVDVYRELVINSLLQEDPALSRYSPLISDVELISDPVYSKFTNALQTYFKSLPFIIKEADLISFLSEPFQLYPESIQDQVEFIRDNWSDFLGDFINILLTGLDILKEEHKNWVGGPGEIPIYDFSLSEEEYEKFSQDSDWMPHLVLIAKSTYVWLDQLSKKYQKNIHRLDQIPDKELQLLAERGFTGLWFIGVWQRSHASQKIKHLTGNTNVIASAYSLSDYRIATELGGEEAMIQLQHRAGRYGIRVACDMVPNHMGLDSSWVIDHPDWFLQLPEPPYPSYSFQGENLTDRDQIEVFLEDHYYEKSDAAVVYKLYDKRDGRSRYIYHGNDGTSIPWNDTAQLNYLLPEVREAVIKNIIRIARQFPIIRFDAAMTLAKKHIQRLWFPQPGSGGDIASRAGYGLSKTDFDKHMPVEFWREVVDRVAAEAPNTLLLAEAFWMMEGYFVRTLGMHRVYNSAFMNMLKNEDNAKYRQSIYNIIEFNPEILKRFVNFMSNPDEDTAISQFGKDDKYFGVCILMITMPGLPMFAHGQIEGFTERYGMEFPKARWEESEDEHLVNRHQREIFPLLKKRIIFSEVKNFLLFDFSTEEGHVNENVFAYSNENLTQRSLVVYNNKFEAARGRIHWANTVIREHEEPVWIRKNLGDALKIPNSNDHYLIFRDLISGLEYIRNCAEIHNSGLFQELGAFKYAVLLDMREVKDAEEGKYAQLAKFLQGGGVPDLNVSLQKLTYQSLYDEFHLALGSGVLKQLMEIIDQPEELVKFLPEFKYRLSGLMDFLKINYLPELKVEKVLTAVINEFKILINLLVTESIGDKQHLFHWIFLKGTATSLKEPEEALEKLLQEFILSDEISEIIKPYISIPPEEIVLLYFSLFKYHNVFHSLSQKDSRLMLIEILQDPRIQKLIGVNRFNDVNWFNLELLQENINNIFITNRLYVISRPSATAVKIEKFDQKLTKLQSIMDSCLKKSEYDLDKLIKLLT
jgi:glycosidase